MNWYYSLTSKGTLNWNAGIDLCGQMDSGVFCDSSNPQRATRMSSF